LKTSAGLLVFRKRQATLQVLLVHPGGPFLRNKDDGAWSIPKGEMAKGEDMISRARIEFEEELGIPAPRGQLIELGSIKQKGGKIVHAWAVEGDLEENFKLLSNTFTIEWPPRSGRISEFPEVDRAEFFPLPTAKRKINPAQVAFLDRLNDLLLIRE
jgi:predicted NUDIX family NTP pyrophosphohydrolase